MENKEKDPCLVLDLFLCDKVSFERKGFKNKNKLQSYYSIGNEKCEGNDNEYRVVLRYRGVKKDEYEIEVIVSGYFYTEDCDEEATKHLIKYNSIAILMPFLRAKISTVSSQFEIDPIIIPVINTDDFVDKYYTNEEEEKDE